MNARPICWTRADIQFATQVDVGGLELADPRADAVFRAIHQKVPIGRLHKAGSTDTAALVTEDDVLSDFTEPLASNEPHLIFITGQAGTGKSHLVRWLRSSIGAPPSWHIVYIEKRNTSLRRVIEQILAGIEGPASKALLQKLQETSRDLSSTAEAMLTLLATIERLVRFDNATAVGDLEGAELAELREKTGRLVGDYTFRQCISGSGGPIERITNLAMHGTDPARDVSEKDLHLSAEDLQIDAEAFADAGSDVLGLIRTLLSNRAFRNSVANLIDHYLARAKAEVFTGRTTDLLDVFDEVRGEIANRRQELCLFVEDLVLLHGIDTQLAQALTIPAGRSLCRIRAAIAVTSGYLRDVTTFAERGVHYTMDVGRNQVGSQTIREFVARYLNAGRVGADALAEAFGRNRTAEIPNACDDCIYRRPCHLALGTSGSGYGLYPFNGTAVDRLVSLASPSGFDPRNILREVVRGPLEVAEDELPQGTFPSSRFAAVLDPSRSELGPEVREQVRRQSATPPAELSLRALYAEHPPRLDEGVKAAAEYFGVSLTEIDLGAEVDGDSGGGTFVTPPPPRGEIDRWVEGARLSANTAGVVRRWILDTMVARLQGGSHGFPVRRSRSGPSNEWLIGAHVLRMVDIRISNAGGEGMVEGEVTLRFEQTDADALLLKGILAAAGSGNLDGPNAGGWFFDLEGRIQTFEGQILMAAARQVDSDVAAALAILCVCRLLATQEAEPHSLLAQMFRPLRREGLHPAALAFVDKVARFRERAMIILRDRLTQAKGVGAPTVFDAGSILADLRAAASVQSLEEPYVGSEEIVQVMSSFNRAQRDAALAIWRDVDRELDRLRPVLLPQEDFLGALDELDHFVDDAHARGLLPEADAKDRYRDLRAQVGSDQMEAYRRLDGLSGKSVEPASLWAVAVDPIPSLRSLRMFATEATRLLKTVAETIASIGPEVGAGDRQGLNDSFRALADHLDQMERLG